MPSKSMSSSKEICVLVRKCDPELEMIDYTEEEWDDE